MAGSNLLPGAAVDTGRLYDYSGTLIPVGGPPAPVDASLLPNGVERDVFDRYRGYPSRALTPARIEAILEAADVGDPFAWVQLCEEMVEKDPKIGSILHTRTAAVLGLVHEVRPVSLDEKHAADQGLADDIAKFCDDALDRAGIDELNGDLLDSIGKPIAVDWIVWGNDEDGKVVPQRFMRIPPTHLRWGTTSDSIRVWNPNGFTMTGGDLGQVFDPYTTVRALNNERRDHPTRAGLLRTLVWYYLFKNTSIKDWVTLADRFGLPQRILQLDSNDFTNPEMYQKARQALASIGSSASGVISKDWILQITAAAAKGGSDLFAAIIAYIDTAMAQLVLGHELSSQGSKGGGQLGISAANQVRQDILEGDCAFLGQVIRRDLLTPMVGWNFGWDKVRLTPTFEFENEPARDLVAEANVTSTIARTFPTMEFSKQQLRGRFGFDAPVDDGLDDGDESGDEPADPNADPAAPPAPAAPDEDSDAITAGGAPGQNPIVVGEPQPGTPDISVNSTRDPFEEMSPARYRSVLDRVAPAPKRGTATARQAKVDRVTEKSAAEAVNETSKWKAQLRTMIREAANEGLTMPELAHRISKAYPDFDVNRLETILHQELLLVRLFGRNS